MAIRRAAAKGIVKAATGLRGFDEMSGGGLPCGRVSVVIGGAGSGKTIFALQTLANAARDRGEPGIFVAFEESADKIMANAASFGWNLQRLANRGLFFIDARLPVEAVQSGGFELTGMLASIGERARLMGARWVAFDAIDVLLDLLPDATARRREISRLQEWNERSNLTCIVTARTGEASSRMAPAYTYMAYMTDCAIQLGRRETDSIVTRLLTILKYRGSPHAENSVPYLIGARGFAAYPMPAFTGGYKVLRQRVSTGVARLDTLLGGGLIRGTVTLLTGEPGTAKTTLSGRFVEAACQRGERALYVCFDESGAEIVRNLTSVGIELGPYQQSGRLRIEGLVSRARSSDAVFADILAAIEENRPRAVVLDPLSALGKQGNDMNAADIAFRIVQECKLRGVTLYLTSLLSESDPVAGSTSLRVSTLADTWIHLSYLGQGPFQPGARTCPQFGGDYPRECVLGRGRSPDGYHAYPARSRGCGETALCNAGGCARARAAGRRSRAARGADRRTADRTESPQTRARGECQDGRRHLSAQPSGKGQYVHPAPGGSS